VSLVVDQLWLSPIQFLGRHLNRDDVLLAPNAFKEYFEERQVSNYRATSLGLAEHCFSLVVVHKGMLDRIQPTLLDAVDRTFVPVFANEVFVIFARSPDRFPPIPPESPHLQAYWDTRREMQALLQSSDASAQQSPQNSQTQPIREFIPDIDVLLCSYPKCGRTWLRFILACYINERCGLGYPPTRETMGILVPFFKVGEEIPLDAIRIDQYLGKHGLRAIAASHQNYSNPNAPKLLAGKDIIFLFRSVFDVLVSQYFERVFRRNFPARGSVWAFIQDEKLLEMYVDYLNAWADNLHYHRHLTVTYEELRHDTAGTVARILEFTGTDVEPELLSRAIALSSFENMQKMERKELGLSDTSEATASLRTRRGKIGGYQDYLSEDEIKIIRQYCGDRLSPKARELFERHNLCVT
jgi:alcohol sulfotransferase